MKAEFVYIVSCLQGYFVPGPYHDSESAKRAGESRFGVEKWEQSEGIEAWSGIGRGGMRIMIDWVKIGGEREGGN
jgi:hypothetical protein